MHPTEIVARLETLSPLDLAATGILLQLLAGTLDTTTLTALQPELARYVEMLEKQAQRGQEFVKRCVELQPQPTCLPPGF